MIPGVRVEKRRHRPRHCPPGVTPGPASGERGGEHKEGMERRRRMASRVVPDVGDRRKDDSLPPTHTTSSPPVGICAVAVAGG
eukprot:136936-Rhodomonas_salina.1